MGLLAADMSSDYRATFVPKTISDFLKEVSLISNVGDKKLKIDDLVMRLEEEMRKIDAFKRELPLCMLLLNDAITALKDESIRYCFPAPQPVLAEFIPLKKDTGEHEDFKKNIERDSKDKKNWMSSFQLWNSSNDSLESCRNHKPANKKVEDQEMYESEDQVEICKSRNEGRGFMPFKTNLAAPIPLPRRKEDNMEIAARVQALSLRTPGMESSKEESIVTSCGRFVPSSEKQSNSRNIGHQPPHQTNRKQRRCWSPELHRKFIDALQQLGGAQVATPKQIRELMQVDGLTNDEVKSHLQKFRLHTRRAVRDTSSSANRSTTLGSLWVSQDQHSDSTKEGNSQSGSPQGPLQLAANALANSGNSGEVEEDDKSDGHSWKSHIQRPRKDIV